MPNWCQNTLSIKGTKEQIVNFNKRYLPNETFSFENIIPSPQTIEECPEDYIIHSEREANRHLLYWDPTQPRNWFNWYDWNCNYWGCKWNATTISVEQNEDSIKIFFETPWDPPIPVIEKLIEDNPQLEIEYESHTHYDAELEQSIGQTDESIAFYDALINKLEKML